MTALLDDLKLTFKLMRLPRNQQIRRWHFDHDATGTLLYVPLGAANRFAQQSFLVPSEDIAQHLVRLVSTVSGWVTAGAVIWLVGCIGALMLIPDSLEVVGSRAGSPGLFALYVLVLAVPLMLIWFSRRTVLWLAPPLNSGPPRTAADAARRRQELLDKVASPSDGDKP